MSNAQAKILASSLELLEKEKCEFLSAVNNHVAKVLLVGQEWIENRGGHRMSLTEVRAVIDNAFELIMSKKEEFTMSDETCEPSASFQSQPLAAVSSSGETSMADVNTESVHKIMARMDSMEQTISALQMTTDRMTEKQDGVEKSCQDNAKKMSDLEDCHAKRLTDVEKQVKKNSKKQKDLLKENNTKLVQVETELKELCTKHDETEDQNMAWKKNIESQIDDAMSQTESKLEDVVRKVEFLETSTEDLSTRIESNTSSVGDLIASRTRTTEKLRELEDGVRTTEERRLKSLKVIARKIADVNKNAILSNELVDKRLDSLEELRTLLNKNAEHRGENVKKLDNLMIEVSDMDSKLKSLETRCTRKPIGFSVTSFPCCATPTKNTVYKGYDTILSNHGGHFDTNTGVFTAPVDGLYVAFVAIRQESGSAYVSVTVRHSQAGTGLGGGGSLVCEACTNGDGRSKSCMGVVEVKAGRMLYVWVDRCVRNVGLSGVNFSCFLIN